MANVKVIAPREQKPDTLRVAAYCRVSSDSSDQLHSYATQIKSYTELIGGQEGWELVDIYADEGLTGTRMDKREDFCRMMADCRKGRIDKVLVKSISRFARNTRDCLASLRELSRLGVTVKFEKENIDTGTLTTELMVSVSGSLAQEESISISKNQRMSYQRRMEKGEFITCYAPYGYRVQGKDLAINPGEATVVKWIFNRFLNGWSTDQIANDLTLRGVPTGFGKGKWYNSPIRYILKNEKYLGNALCQKYYTPDILPFICKPNHGEKDQYYVENTHQAIISPETFQKAQALLKMKAGSAVERHCSYPLTLKITCGKCGTVFSRRATVGGHVSWVCRRHDNKASACPVGRTPETEIYAAFVRMYNKLRQNDGLLLQPALQQLDDLNAALQRDNPAMLEVNRSIAETAEQSHKISKLRSAGLLDADACAVKLAEIDARMTQLRSERRRLLKNDDIQDAIDALRRTADIIRDGPERLGDFDETLFDDLVERIVAESQTIIRFHLYGGIELTEQLREVGR